MLARLQQAMVGLLLCAMAAWMAWMWPRSPALAIVGAVALLFAHGLVLAVEFVIVWRVNRAEPVPKPSAAQLFRAWWLETRMGWQVFGWRQPFRSRAVANCTSPGSCDPHRCGVVLVHGFVCNRGFWTPWLARLREAGHPYIAVNLEPVFGSIDDYAATLDAAVRRLTDVTGRPPVLVCHSMGGLAARAWLRTSADARVAHIITIGTPHGGTWLGRFSRAANGRQMHLRSAWLGTLGEGEGAERRSRFTCWYSNCDNVVFPATTATLAGADNRLVLGMPHVALAFDHEVMRASLAKIGSL